MLKPVSDPASPKGVPELVRDPCNYSKREFIIRVGLSGVALGDPPLERPLTDPKQLSLTALRDRKHLIEPTRDFVNRAVFGHGLALGQSGKEEAQLLQGDADSPSLLYGLVIVLARAERP